MPGLVHFASQKLEVGGHVRQRCVWCGVLLTDYDGLQVAAQLDADSEPPPVWEPGDLVDLESASVVEAPAAALYPERVVLYLPDGYTTCFDVDR